MNTDITINPNEMIYIIDDCIVEGQKHFYTSISYVKDELTKKDGTVIYVLLYEKLCNQYPDKVKDFVSLLKLYEEDYEKTCIAIISSLGENDDKNGIW